jgi:hypothetical protein
MLVGISAAVLHARCRHVVDLPVPKNERRAPDSVDLDACVRTVAVRSSASTQYALQSVEGDQATRRLDQWTEGVPRSDHPHVSCSVRAELRRARPRSLGSHTLGGGIEAVLDLPLSASERVAFQKSGQTLKDRLGKLGCSVATSSRPAFQTSWSRAVPPARAGRVDFSGPGCARSSQPFPTSSRERHALPNEVPSLTRSQQIDVAHDAEQRAAVRCDDG